MARGDSAFGTKKVIGACLDEQVEFSLTLSRNRRVTKAIDSIDETEWTPVHYPGAVEDPDTGALISDAEVAETSYSLSVRGHGRVTARLVVRRACRDVRDAGAARHISPPSTSPLDCCSGRRRTRCRRDDLGGYPAAPQRQLR